MGRRQGCSLLSPVAPPAPGASALGPAAGGQQGPRPVGHVLGGEAELLHDDAAGRRGAEVVDARRRRRRSAPSRAWCRPRPRGSGRRGAAPPPAVLVGLLPRTAPSTASTPPGPRCPVRQEPLGASTHTETSEPVPRSTRSRLVRARRRACRRPGRRPLGPLGRALENGEPLAGQDEGGRAVALDVDPPRLRRLVGVGRADDPQPRDRPQRGEVLDRLVGRTVLTEADGVVRPDEGDVRACSARPGGRRAACSRRRRRTCRRRAGRRRGAAMPFMVEPMPCSRTPKWIWRPLQSSRVIDPRSFSSVPVLPVRSAPPPRSPGNESSTASRTSAQAARVATSRPPATTGSFGSQPQPAPPGQAGLELLGQLRLPRPELLDPLRPGLPLGCAPPARPPGRGQHVVGHPEVLRRHAEDLLDLGDLVLAERLAVRLRGVGELGRRVADVAAQDDERRPVLDGHGLPQRRSRGRRGPRRPRRARGRASRRPRSAAGLVGECELGRAVDGDVVVVVDVDEAAEPEVAGERRGLVAHALLEVAVGADGEHVVVAHLGPEARPQVALRRWPCRRRWRSPGRAGRW